MLSGLLGIVKSLRLWGLKLSILKKLRVILIYNISLIKPTILRVHLYKILQRWVSIYEYAINFFSCNNDSTISAKIKSQFSVKFGYSEKAKIISKNRALRFDISNLNNFKTKWKIFSNFVNFSKKDKNTKFQTFSGTA